MIDLKINKSLFYTIAVGILGYSMIKLINHHKQLHQYQQTIVLLGDVGGTNIRLELVTIKPPHNHPDKYLKKHTYQVKQYQSLQFSIRQFLTDVKNQPKLAVIAIAGPISDNKVQMANVPQWNLMSGDEIGQSLNIAQFKFINDFQANSYGLLVIPQDQFISINGLKVQSDKVCGVMGPGTGLGNSILFTSPFRKRKRVYVLTSQGGHTDFPCIDQESKQFFNYLKKNMKLDYISLQRSFCGPTIPYMFDFYKQKYPQDPHQHLQNVKPQFIIEQCLKQEKSPIYHNVLRLFLKIYGAAIGNYMSHHMCVGGIYLVGSLTNTLLPELIKTDLLYQWRKRHPQIQKTIQKMPILVCKEIDLGLKGAFVMARRIIADEQHQ